MRADEFQEPQWPPASLAIGGHGTHGPQGPIPQSVKLHTPQAVEKPNVGQGGLASILSLLGACLLKQTVRAGTWAAIWSESRLVNWELGSKEQSGGASTWSLFLDGFKCVLANSDQNYS